MMHRTSNSQPKPELDSLCGQFTAAWEAGDAPLIENYLERALVDDRGPLLEELLQIELWFCRHDSSKFDPDSYKVRFPKLADVIDVACRRFGERTLSLVDETKTGDSSVPPLCDATTLPVPELSVPDSSAHDFETAASNSKTRMIGRYTIVQQLGSGSQGDVYRAVHPNLPIELAIKVSVKPLNEAYHQALKDEAQVLCDLDHPNIARLRDLDFDQGKPLLVLDYIRGRTLRELLWSGDIAQEQAIDWLATAARAIDFAHRRGVVHLDLKPENIVIDEGNQPIVIDFGMARLRGVWNDPSLERDGISGTPNYMSPEQAGGKAQRIGSHSDIFALGAILYHILVGVCPFRGTDAKETLEAAQRCDFDQQQVERLATRRKLADACLKAMSANPEDRFASANEFADAISPERGEGRRPAASERSASSSFRLLGIGVALAASVIALLIVFRDPGVVNRQTETAIIPTDASAIREFKITHIGNSDDRAHFSAPLFNGRAPRVGDDIQAAAQFNHSVYCFLFALNPDGAVQLCFPDLESKAQADPISGLVFPSDEEMAFGLTDGDGYQAFVLVTSENALPAFRVWKSSLPEMSWPADDISGNWVYSAGTLTPKQFVGEEFDPRKIRGPVRHKKDPTAFKAYLDAIGGIHGIEVTGVMFEVRAKVDES